MSAGLLGRAALSLLAGLTPYLLAFMDSGAFAVQVGAAVLAVLLGIWTLLDASKLDQGKAAAVLMSGLGLFLGGLFLLAMGGLWLLWPR